MRQPLRQNGPSILRSPVAIGGLAAIAVALIAVIAVIVTAGGDGGDNGSGSSVVVATKSPASSTDAPLDGLDGLTGVATSTLNVRSGPGNTYAAMGSLRRGAEVRITGQSDDGEWLQIEYPARSNLRGWVITGSLEVQGDLAAVPIATPDVLPLPDIPTYEAIATLPALETPEEAIETPTATPETAALPDLVVGGSLVSGSTLVVTVTNQGSGALPAAEIGVAVYDTAGVQQLASASLAVDALEAGASIDIQTGYVPFGGPDEVLVIVDPSGAIPETDDTNNRLVVSFTPDSEPAATETPQP